MGVRGLWKYLRNNGVKFQTLELSTQSGKTLVCDAMAIFYWLMEILFAAKVKSGEYSKYSAIYGGNFNDYRERLLGFVEALKHLGIRPIFFIDGPAFGLEHEITFSTQKDRYKRNLETIDTYHRVCEYDRMTEPKYEKRIKKVLLFKELLQALSNVGVEIRICTGQADRAIAQYARNHSEEVCGVLTSDTDLMLMTGCPAIHYKLFDCDDELKLNSTEMKNKPREIKCKVFTSRKIAEHFGIKETCLPALAILCGNDSTRRLNEVNGVIGGMFSWPDANVVSLFIKDHESNCETAKEFLEIEKIKEICEKCPEYHRVVEYSYKFYRRAPVIPVDSLYHTHWIAKEVLIHKRLDIFFLEVLCGYFWRSEVEQISIECPCIYETTLPVRKLMYSLLSITRHRVMVREYGMLRNEYYEQSVHVEDSIDITKLCGLRALPIKNKLYALFRLFCEPREPIPLISSLDMPLEFNVSLNTTLTCSCILFARKYGLIPDEKFVTPLLIACMLCRLGKVPPQTTSRPGPIAVTIAAQFMVLLQHIRWLASLVGLEDQLPLPSTTFQPFVYIPLHDVVFKISQKDKFRGEKPAASKSYYDCLVTKNKSLADLKECICTGSIDGSKFMETATKFMQVQKWFEEHFKPKAAEQRV